MKELKNRSAIIDNLYVSCLLVVMALFSVNSYAQQDIQNSQYMFNFSTINPAYVGSRDVLDISLSNRSQWVGFDGAPKTQIVTIHAPLTKKKIGFGFQASSDAIGPRKVIGLNTAYSYRIRIGGGKLRFGLRAGIYSFSYDWNSLNYENKEDDVIPIDPKIRMATNFDFGMYYNNRLNYFGLEIAHLNRAKLYKKVTAEDVLNTAFLYPSLSLFYGRAFEINKKITIKSSALYRKTTNSPGYLDVNVSAFLLKKIWVGASYRTTKAVVFITQYYINKKIRVGYSYDLNLNKIAAFNGGSHEIFLGFDVPIFKTEMQSPRYF